MRERAGSSGQFAWRTMVGVATALWLACGLVAGRASAAEGKLIAVDFENVDLRIFIKFVSEATGRVFLVDDRVQGRVSVRFTNEIPVEQLYEVLESVLEVKGYAAIPAGYITKIVPLNGVKQRGVEVTGKGRGSAR
jgi:general secretion pathway protein D